jgi:protein ImuB
MVVCVLIPRFPLLAALGERRALISEPVALAPEAGGLQMVGEASAAAEATGVTAGMRMGEALSRCPGLKLVAPDPEGTRALWNVVLDAIESIGAAPESERAGTAFFEASGLRGIHGGDLKGVLDVTRGVLRRDRGGRGFAARLGSGPSRFTSLCAARQARPRKPPPVVGERGAAAFLAPLPASLLRFRPELAPLVEALDRLGIRTLGELATLPSRAVAERFGHPGLLALDLTRGRDTPLEPRRPPEPVLERIDLPEAASGQQLERALELLIGRVLARRERRGRSLRGVAVSARFVAGGTWRESVTLRMASADPERLSLTLKSRLSHLPAPADSLALEVEAFGPPANHQSALIGEEGRVRRDRLGEAVRQARQAAGDDAALRVLDVDPDSRLPERRSSLTPWNS